MEPTQSLHKPKTTRKVETQGQTSGNERVLTKAEDVVASDTRHECHESILLFLEKALQVRQLQRAQKPKKHLPRPSASVVSNEQILCGSTKRIFFLPSWWFPNVTDFPCKEKKNTADDTPAEGPTRPPPIHIIPSHRLSPGGTDTLRLPTMCHLPYLYTTRYLSWRAWGH